MRHRFRAHAANAAAAVVLALVVSGAAPATAAPPASAPTSTVLAAATGDVTFTGHGWGHGRGMGQYGALGYAVDYGKSSSWILDHYYGGTTAGTVANSEMTVELVGVQSMPLVVTGTHVYVHTTSAPGTRVDLGTAARFTVLSDGHVRVEKGDGCAPSKWTLVSNDVYVSGQTRVQASPGATAVGDLIRVCYSSYERAYRGELSVVRTGTSQMTINHLPTESYLRGVVPRESPASWGDLGGGKGMEALKAQSVAARTYALASSRASGAKTCDTTSCQVYGGAGLRYPGGPVTSLEDARTDTAISATAGKVRFKSGTTTPVRTEFSSSTGGWTTGGAFTAVEDLGDAISSNPNHNWTATYTLAEVASKLGLSSVRSIKVTARNGLGDLGGRVSTVAVVDGSGGVHSYSGGTFRSAMGTSRFKSDWFAVSMVSVDEAEHVVRALYHDVLDRSVDSSGLRTWTEYLTTGGEVSGLVREIATSRERMNALVTAQYRAALSRKPEASGLDHWVAHLAAGRGVYDLQVGIYGSPESLSTLGHGSVDTWVGALYRRVLGRSSSSTERAYWTRVAAAQGREAVVASIAKSDEATLRRLTVYYRTFLLRGVDSSGKATFLPMMTGRGDFEVPVHLGSSPEYWTRAQTR